MQYTSLIEIHEDIRKLQIELGKLANSLADSGNIDYVQDWCYLLRMDEKLDHFVYMMKVVNDYQLLIYLMESEKDRFEVQKMAQDIFTDFSNGLDNLIEAGRLWKYEDYRCIDWAKRLNNSLDEVIKYYNEKILPLN